METSDSVLHLDDEQKHCELSRYTALPGDNRDMEPPDPIPNSEVKRVIADDSVGSPHVKVGHYQDLIVKPRVVYQLEAFFMLGFLACYLVQLLIFSD